MIYEGSNIDVAMCVDWRATSPPRRSHRRRRRAVADLRRQQHRCGDACGLESNLTTSPQSSSAAASGDTASRVIYYCWPVQLGFGS
ncbi:hypothetical protein E2562_019650 [Oryza meyeriana var. granulata]|uniref:Uncharacterized protein n=1 Tax=Oryza meyeriana var. granulata TaxID=110450 RepID=A0A6G1C840_9ORYZ|nr:hypothetical protein E2562_019650 [Oryza meyeriana var. granulata]